MKHRLASVLRAIADRLEPQEWMYVPRVGWHRWDKAIHRWVLEKETPKPKPVMRSLHNGFIQVAPMAVRVGTPIISEPSPEEAITEATIKSLTTGDFTVRNVVSEFADHSHQSHLHDREAAGLIGGQGRQTQRIAVRIRQVFHDLRSLVASMLERGGK